MGLPKLSLVGVRSIGEYGCLSSEIRPAFQVFAFMATGGVPLTRRAGLERTRDGVLGRDETGSMGAVGSKDECLEIGAGGIGLAEVVTDEFEADLERAIAGDSTLLYG